MTNFSSKSFLDDWFVLHLFQWLMLTVHSTKLLKVLDLHN